MRGTGGAVGWLVGIVCVHTWPTLPTSGARWVCALLILLMVLAALKFKRLRPVLVILMGCCLAVLWACWRADVRLADRLHPSEDNRVSRVAVAVVSLPQVVDGGVRFIAELLAPVPPALAKRVLVDWPGACTDGCAKRVTPGQRWRMALRFRQPQARQNFFGFDAQAWLFAQGVGAIARVRGEPRLLSAPARPSLLVAVQGLRDRIRRRLLRVLKGQREAPVLVALAIGDQQGVSSADWQIFNLTGITHLVSISGSHVTLIAALGGGMLAWMWRRLRWRGRSAAERVPVRVVFVWGSLAMALLYCLIAGWGVPAQRTFFMLALMALAFGARLPVSGPQAVAWAGVAITALEPWAVLSTGFWLSFGAMAVLIAMAQVVWQAGQSREDRWSRWRALAWEMTGLQVMITLATLPVLAYLFNMVSFASLPANAWAIPMVTFVATPLALLLSVFSLLPIPDAWLWPLAWLAHQSLVLSLAPVRWLAQFSGLSWEVPTMPLPLLLLSLAGVGGALLLPVLRWRPLGWCLMLPGLLYRPPVPGEGGWQLTAFDVGQGGALLVQTRTQVLLFDTGWRFGPIDAGARVILPELRARGIRRLDYVVVSHPDIDHIGGLATLEQQRAIGRLYASGLPDGQATACRSGQAWAVDGVRFSFIHPQDDCSGQRLQGVLRNRCSCVLRVDGAWHSVLLTGDIDQAGERDMLKHGLEPVTVVTMPHHGSRTGSSPALVTMTGAAHAIAQAGHRNRFDHPAPEVVRRWQSAGAKTWVSSRDGALVFQSRAAGLMVQSARQARQRFWHLQPSPKIGH